MMNSQIVHVANVENYSCERRQLFTEDIDQILQLQERIFSREDFEKDWFYPFDEEELWEILSDDENIIQGIFAKNRMIGFTAFCCKGTEWQEITTAMEADYPSQQYMLINGTLIDWEFQRNGLQKMLTHYTMNRSIKKGMSKFVMACHPENQASIKSYEKLGFKPIMETLLHDKKYKRIILIKENQAHEKK